MTEKQNFLRIVKNIYDSIIPLEYSGTKTDIEKLKELDRWNKEFIYQTNNVEKMLNDYINLGLINQNDRDEMEIGIKEINSN